MQRRFFSICNDKFKSSGRSILKNIYFFIAKFVGVLGAFFAGFQGRYLDFMCRLHERHFQGFVCYCVVFV